MATLVFDIETVPFPWESFDVYTQSKLLSSYQVSTNDSVGTLRVKHLLGLSPLTGTIVSVAMYDVERRKGAVYYVGDKSADVVLPNGFIAKARTEKEILEDFWEGARSYDVFVSFNGRSFDVPFLIHRSVARDVMPSISFAQSRYLSRQQLPYHVDLLDEFSFYGAMSKRPSLHLLCHAYGIESKKSEMDGSQVAELFQAKKFRDLALHNAEDVIATAALYEKWKTYLAPRNFLNAIEF